MKYFTVSCCWILASCVLNCGSLPPLSAKNVVTEIYSALKDNPDTNHLLKYMKMSDQELVAALPLTANTGYTLFAPTDVAFVMAIGQDSGNPFYDPDLRNQVLLRHFVRRRLSKEELGKLTSLEMASGETYNFTQKNGTTEIQVESISVVSEEVIKLDDITIFFVNYPFVSSEETSNAMERHPFEPYTFNGNGPFPQTPYDQLPKFPNGGYNRVAVDNEEVVKSAQFATQEISKKEGQTRQSLTLKKIQSAGTQIFYGELYKLVLELMSIKYNKTNPLVCHAVVFNRFYLNETKLYESSCI